MPASAPQPMTEVAKPVMVVAACIAQRRLGAVIRIAVPRIGKASAKTIVDADAVSDHRAHATSWNGVGVRKQMLLHREHIAGAAEMMVVIAGKAAVDGLVIAGIDLQRLAPAIMGDAPVAHDEIAVLEDEMGGAEHFRHVLVGRIDRDIGEPARPEMAAILEAEQLRRRRAGHDGDFAMNYIRASIEGSVVIATASCGRRAMASARASRLMISAKTSG